MRISLTQFLCAESQAGRLPDDLRALIETTAQSCKNIAASVQKGALLGILGEAGTADNVQGETQKALDVIANDILLAENAWGGTLAAMASEEMALPHAIPEGLPKGRYLLLFDPLDGSSNLNINLTVGTIFSVLVCPEGSSPNEASSFFQAGKHQVAAGYALYGPQTSFVFTIGHGVVSFTLDREQGQFILTEQGLTIPASTQEFAINLSNMRHWEAPVKRYVDELLAGETGVRGKNFNLRWVACMVADVHRILTRGGIFLYPYDLREPNRAGRLRLMYEANPLAMLVEQAGGLTTNGRVSMLDVVPHDLHQRVPVFMGSKEEVERVTRYHLEAK